MCGLDSDICGIHIISLAARFRTAANSGTLVNAWPNFVQLVNTTVLFSLRALTPEWEERELKPSMALSTMEAYENVRQIVLATLPTLPEIGYRMPPRPCSATRFKNVILLYQLPNGPPKNLGPISRHHVAQILPMIRNAARASRPGLAFGVLRVLCNGMCAAKRFHIDTKEQTCRVGCPLQQAPSPLSYSCHNLEER